METIGELNGKKPTESKDFRIRSVRNAVYTVLLLGSITGCRVERREYSTERRETTCYLEVIKVQEVEEETVIRKYRNDELDEPYSIRRNVSNYYIVTLSDGRKFKTQRSYDIGDKVNPEKIIEIK